MICRYCKMDIKPTDPDAICYYDGYYVHRTCMHKEAEDREKLKQVIFKYLGYDADWLKIDSQIDKILGRGYDYADISKCVEYCFKFGKGDKDKAKGGIAIVDYSMTEAQQYYNKKRKLEEELADLKENGQIGEIDLSQIKVDFSNNRKFPLTRPKSERFLDDIM